MKQLRAIALFSWKYAYLLLPALGAALIVYSHLSVLEPVLISGGDNLHHYLSQYVIHYSYLAGDNPFGPTNTEFGVPILRFYQALFYLVSVGLHIVTKADIRLLHNILMVTCFALSPFSYCYFLRKLGLRPWAASIGSLVSIISIAGFGNSFEAYHGCGIVTQSMGALFFPWFMGNCIGMLRGENRVVGTSVLFALAFLSHAIMAVYAVFAGVLYFLVAPVGIARNWKRITAFGLLGAALVAFWVFPFITHTQEMRAVPDSIIRGQSKRWWFASVSKDEMVETVISGKLFDDPSAYRDAQTDRLDKLVDWMNIARTRHTRPSVVTVLLALGVLASFLSFRRTPHRFLLAGLAFSLLLFAGADDYPWLGHLPFIKHIQFFRVTYFLEFFAFGLVGIGIEAVLRLLWSIFNRLFIWVRVPTLIVWFAIVIAGTGWTGHQILEIGDRFVRIHRSKGTEMVRDAYTSLPDLGYPFRSYVSHKSGAREDVLGMYGYRPSGTHWAIVGPSATLQFSNAWRANPLNSDLAALGGVRYFSGRDEQLRTYIRGRDLDGVPLYDRLPNGPSSSKRSLEWHYLLDSGRDHFLRPMILKPFPVVCGNDQWIWITKSWMRAFGKKLWDPSTPLPIRVKAGELKQSGLLPMAGVVLYADTGNRDNDTLAKFASNGGTVVSPVDIEGVPITKPGLENTIWKVVAAVKNESAEPVEAVKLHSDENDPGLELATITRYDDPRHSSQRYDFDVDTLEPMILILPTQAVPGWKTTLDGDPHPVFPAGPDMLGILLPYGAHRISFRWSMPTSEAVTLYLSLAALAFALLYYLALLAGRILASSVFVRTGKTRLLPSQTGGG